MLKKGRKSDKVVDYDVRDGFDQTLKEVERHLSTIEKLLESQKVLLSLDAIFSQSKLKESLKEDHKSFQSIRSAFASLMHRLSKDPRLASLKIFHSEFSEGLDQISNKGTLV